MGFETTYIGGKLVYNCSLTAETHILNDINIFLIYIYIYKHTKLGGPSGDIWSLCMNQPGAVCEKTLGRIECLTSRHLLRGV